jgi:dephospho-CoA kinase
MKNKIAIFICGSGGSGKSTFSKTYFPTYTIIDVDIIYEELLIESGLHLKIKNFNEEQIKQAAGLFEKSKSLNDKKFNDTITKGDNMVIDSIGRDSETIMYQRSYLEKMGYTTYMIMMYAELDICIERVENRNRTYNKNITIDSWYLSYSNISIYKREFGKRFLLVYNDDTDWKSKFQIFIDNDINKKTIV